MQFLRQIQANPNTRIVAQWYATGITEHHQLLADAEQAGHIYMRPESPRQEVQTWRCRPPGVNCGQPGEYLLIWDKPNGASAYVLFANS